MQRSFKDYLTITLKGMAMGAADVVPGVSGGTIAFITGIYQELISTISGINLGLFTTWKEEGFKAMWKEANGTFIVALLTGILISIFTVMRLTNYLLESHYIINDYAEGVRPPGKAFANVEIHDWILLGGAFPEHFHQYYVTYGTRVYVGPSY